jgi:hypothetical protein
MSNPWSQTKQRAALPDYCAPEHADKLVERIKAYWASRDFKPLVVAEKPPFGRTQGRPRADVRSDMVNGWPREARTQ